MTVNNVLSLKNLRSSLVMFFQDLRYGMRQLIKTPGFTIVAVLILAVGIGINTTIFSMINAVLLRSLPVPNPHELCTINWMGRKPQLNNYAGSGMGRLATGMVYSGSFPYTAYREFRENGKGFADVFSFFSINRATIQTRGLPSTLDGLMTSKNFFSGYGSRMALGRIFAPRTQSTRTARNRMVGRRS